jgi:hypothetical protein
MLLVFTFFFLFPRSPVVDSLTVDKKSLYFLSGWLSFPIPSSVFIFGSLPDKVEDDEEEQEAAKRVLPESLLHHFLRAHLQP